MRRVLVVGMSGSGKTTAARRVGARLGLPFHEMDALALGPHWSQPPGLVDEVKRITADTILWLDYPATVVLPRLIRRSVVRTATNAELFGGNRETLREWLSPEHPVWSAAATFRHRREYLFDRTASSPHCRTVRFTAQREFERRYELL